MVLFWCSVAASAVAGVGCGYLMTATILLRRLERDRAGVRRAATPAVTILKPLHGNEPGLLENLGSFCAQDYPGDIQIVCGVQHTGDGAVAVVGRLRELNPDRHLDLVVDAKVRGLNRKVSNLVNMAPRIRHEVVVLADSDIRVDAGYLCRVIAALEQPGVGAVSCLYCGVALTGVWARLAALLINAQFLPSVVVALAFGLAHPCFGSTLALRRGALTAIGGFKPFVDCLADDYAMGAALRAQGCNVAIPRFAVAHVCTQTSLRELWRHQLRWARTIRSIDPIGYAGTLVTHPVPWALIAVLLGAGSTALLPAVAVAIAAIACRMVVLRQVERAYRVPSQPHWLVPACDLLSFAVFAISFLNWEVSWKGHRFRMVAGDWTADRGTNQ
jgi:ceramide glucosyltransferase